MPKDTDKKENGDLLTNFVTVTQRAMMKEQQSIADMLSNSTKTKAEEIFSRLNKAIDTLESCINENNDVCMMSSEKAYNIVYLITSTYDPISEIVGDLTHKYDFDKEMAKTQADTNIEAVEISKNIAKLIINQKPE